MNSSFLLKKLLEGIFMPFPLCLLLIAVGTILLWLKRAGRPAKYMITVGIGVLIIVSNPIVGYHLVHNLESRFPPLPAELVTIPSPATLHALSRRIAGNAEQLNILSSEIPIVVLGGGGIEDPESPDSHPMSPISALRLVKAVQIFRQMEGSISPANSVEQPRIIISGAATTEAIPMEKLAKSLGVPAADIVLETRSDDTPTQAEHIVRIVGDRPFILVTSAIHMPRTVALFRHLGMHPVPLPANYLSPKKDEMSIMKVLPSIGALDKTTEALHELLGMGWEHLHGQL